MLTKEEFAAIKVGDHVKVSVYLNTSIKRMMINRTLDLPNEHSESELVLRIAARWSGELVIALVEAGCYHNTSRWSKLSASSYAKMGLVRENLPFDSVKFDWIELGRNGIRSVSTEIPVIRKEETPPLPCKECKQFYPYAVANFGEQLVCWGCRDSMAWKYGKNELGQVYLK